MRYDRPFSVTGSAIGVFGALLMGIGCMRAPVPSPPQPAFTQHRWPAGAQTPFGVAVADLNEDGRPDLAVTAVGSDRLTTLLATADGFTPQLGPVVGEVGRGVSAADLNRDGHSDLVVADVALNSAVVLLGDGRGGFTATSHMARLAPDFVKVDQSLVRNVHRRPYQAALLHALSVFAGLILIIGYLILRAL